MICIIKFGANKEISGWILADDFHDARRQADSAGERELAAVLYRMEFLAAGKYPLHVDQPAEYVMLVS